MDLTAEEQSQYTVLIDDILGSSDLSIISNKKVRAQLQEKLGKDISSQKRAINALIVERFDNLTNDAPISSPVQTTKSKANVHADSEVSKTNGHKKHGSSTSLTPEDSDADARPKKKQRKSNADSDAKLAAMLQAQENSRGRATRGAVNKKPGQIKKKATPKKKSAAKIKAADDSDLELDENGEKKEVVRKGGFHKQYALSEPLAQLVGESQLSRPQVVKKIWEHIKAADLQDPSDKRQIICDDRMRSVFKQDTVHMFTMNKLLGKQLYPIEEPQD